MYRLLEVKRNKHLVTFCQLRCEGAFGYQIPCWTPVLRDDACERAGRRSADVSHDGGLAR